MSHPIRSLVSVCQALRNKNRAKILQFLREHGESRTFTIARQLDMNGPTVSKSLKILEEEGLVSNRLVHGSRIRGIHSWWNITDFGKEILSVYSA